MSLVPSLVSNPLQTALTAVKPKATAAANSTSGASSSTSTTKSSTSPADAIGSTFLSLLVQELQNQDPTAPMDSTAMVGQMISLNQLNQLTNINQVLSNAYGTSSSTTSSGPSSPTKDTLSATQSALRLLNAAPQTAHPAIAASVTLPAF